MSEIYMTNKSLINGVIKAIVNEFDYNILEMLTLDECKAILVKHLQLQEDNFTYAFTEEDIQKIIEEIDHAIINQT